MNKPVIGLTGPTGAGKSTAAATFRKLGCAVIDADALAREAVGDKECVEALAREFGAEIVCPDGSLDRHLLAERAFVTPEKTEQLNRIMHPAIERKTIDKIEEFRSRNVTAIILDVPLLFESGADSLCDTTVAITAPPEIRLQRIMKRDGITEEAARERMHVQHPNKFYEERAGYVLNGCVGFDALEDSVTRLLERILRKEHEIC